MTKKSVLLPIARKILAEGKLMPTRISHYIMHHKEGEKKEGGNHYIDYNGMGDDNVHYQLNDFCFARMKSALGFQEVRVLVNQHINAQNTPNSYKGFDQDIFEWYDYVTKESPLRSAFTNARSRNRAWLKDGLRLNLKEDSTFVMAACTLLRNGYEFKPSLYTWKHLVNKGMGKNEAALVAQILYHFPNKGFVMSGGGGHSLISAWSKKEKMLAFVNDKLIPRTKTPISSRMLDWRVNDWIGGGGSCLHDFINSLSKAKGGGWDVNRVVDLNDDAIVNKLKEWFK